MIKVLAITSNPDSQSWLRLDREIEALREELVKANAHGFDFNVGLAVSAGSLMPRLRAYLPDILHFSGHGLREGLVFESDDGSDERVVTAQVLAESIKIFKIPIRCVLLNACNSLSVAETLAKEVDCAIGMADEILDEEATTFSSAFYSGIFQGGTVRDSFTIAKQQLKILGCESKNLPRLVASTPEAELTVFRSEPEICCEFVLSASGNPSVTEGHYKIRLFVRNVPPNVHTVTYRLHSSFKNRYRQVLLGEDDNDDQLFSTEIRSYGGFTVAAMLWNSRAGIGIYKRLDDALERSHLPTENSAILKAIENIRRN